MVDPFLGSGGFVHQAADSIAKLNEPEDRPIIVRDTDSRRGGWVAFKAEPVALRYHDEMKSGVRAQMDKITTTIKREWLKTIANRTKRVEYRKIKPYWVNKLSKV